MPIIIVSMVIAFIVIAQMRCYRRFWQHRLKYTTRFSRQQVVEGDTVILHEELVNNKMLPLPWLFVQIWLPFGITPANLSRNELVSGSCGSIFSVRAYTAIRRRRSLVCESRGVFRLRLVQLNASDLLHMREFSDTSKQTSELVVFPKTLEFSHDIAVINRHLNEMIVSRRLINPDPFEFKGIREYQPTDALKSINFKATAKAGQLMSNIFAPTDAVKLTIVLNLEYTRKIPLALYEQSIRLVATIAHELTKKSVQVAFVTNGKDTTTAKPIRVDGGMGADHLRSILECLARAGTGQWCDAMATYTSTLKDQSQMYVFVSAYCEQDFMDAFRDLARRRVSAFLIVPFFGSTDCETGGNVLCWDAGYGH